MNIYTIYLITNLINNKKYVGQTKQSPEKRFKQHYQSIRVYPISKAIQKYGKENFSFEVIYQTLDVDLVDFLERHFIKEHNSFICENGHGYNLTMGGECNKIISVDTKRKMSESHKNVPLKEQHKQNIILSLLGNTRNLGNILSEQHKQNISKGGKGIPKPQQNITCPHCNKEGGHVVMNRWHFDNCKNQENVESLSTAT